MTLIGFAFRKGVATHKAELATQGRLACPIAGPRNYRPKNKPGGGHGKVHTHTRADSRSSPFRASLATVGHNGVASHCLFPVVLGDEHGHFPDHTAGDAA